jgi:hypothetical protein
MESGSFFASLSPFRCSPASVVNSRQIHYKRLSELLCLTFFRFFFTPSAAIAGPVCALSASTLNDVAFGCEVVDLRCHDLPGRVAIANAIDVPGA